MLSDIRRSFTPNLVVGIGITALGIVLTLDRLRLTVAQDWFMYWPVLLMLFGASVVNQGFLRQSDGVGVDRHQRPIVSPMFVIVLVIIGIAISQAPFRTSAGARSETNDTVHIVAVMSTARQNSVAQTFRGGNMTSVMGESQLDLRQAKVAPGEEVVIDVFGMMGAVVIYVPDDWVVDVRTLPVMGGVKDQRFSPALRLGRRARREAERDRADAGDDVPIAEAPEAPLDPSAGPPPRVVVRGFIMMGALNIRS